MPLPQICTILYFIFMLRLPAIYGGPVAKPGCPNMCGNLAISYPYGVGSNCSLDPSFTISCNTATEPPKAYLSIIDKQLIEINETYIRVKYPNLVSVCYESEGDSYNDSMSVNLTGTLCSLSMYTNRLTAIGCDDAVLQSNGTYNNGGCSAFCEEHINTQTGYCPFDPTSIGTGCCQAQIVGETGLVGAELIDLSRKVQRRKVFPCSYAFIQEVSDTYQTGFSYPLFYLHNSTALQNDNWASATSPPVVRLDWIAGLENCNQAKLNPTSYACRDERSLCVDVANVSRGYRCSCVQVHVQLFARITKLLMIITHIVRQRGLSIGLEMAVAGHSYAFLGTKDDYYEATYPIFNNSTQILSDDPHINYRPTIVPLDWRIGAVNCKDARLNPTDYVCQNNTVCIDFDDTVRGYLCNCSKGYQGNPYLSPGCKDIDECADSAPNACVSNSICINVVGSYHCSCPKGYVGDGTPCIKVSPSNTKTIILAGMGSGLGFLVLALMLSQRSIRVEDESEDVRFFEDIPGSISENDFTLPFAKPGCQNMCGNLAISYPFGIGSNCSFDPSFTISCNTTTDPPKAYLSIIDKQLIEINETYVRVKYPNLVSVCYESEGDSYKDSIVSVNLTRTLYSLSMYTNRLTAIGCDDVVLQSNGTYNNGGCSAFCEDDISTQTGYCPFDPTSIGSGCCQSQIVGETGFVGAKLIDLSRKVQRRKLFPCSHAFIQEVSGTNETGFSYPLFYLHNSTALQTDNWASATSPPVVRLDWIAGVENCSQAKLNPTTYACQDSKSLCVDVANVSKGYQCSCLQGYEGNPSIARDGCRDQCGELSIPFPFGVGRNCYLEPSFEVNCDMSSNPPKAYLFVLKAEIIRLNLSQVRVNYPTLGFSCYNWSDTQRRIIKTEEQSLSVDLLGTQFTLSEDSWISVIGCDDIMVGITRRANRTFVGSTCATVCKNNQIATDYLAYCPTKGAEYWPGNGCCRAPIPRGTSYLEANLSDFTGRWPRTNFSCSYAFLGTKEDYYRATYPIFNNSTQVQSDDPNINYRPTIFSLDWRIGALNCKEALKNPTDYVCQNNTICIDFDDTVRGYLCNCSNGYQGHPYLSPGCKDIDECADSTTNECVPTSICINDPGSYHCSCPKGHVGDGRKDGTSCIKLPPSNTKTIILAGNIVLMFSL
ncbi:hypothetical protein SASPL_156085 [Salvia splendens]|uniref:EGF-like domain-containing protein n=1 Tax=Salvia splendens TaxID=180675 RepID=A0A8X8YXD8_SALSN|nr:hypothetical protein SASPL_156085 [Salvia splendens]